MINKKTLIKIFTFLGGIYFFLEFYLPEEIGGVSVGGLLSQYNDQVTLSIRIIGSMAIGLGLINILTIHVPKVIFLKKNMVNSLGLLLGLVLMLAVAVGDWVMKEQHLAPANHFIMLSEYSQKVATQPIEQQLLSAKLIQQEYYAKQVHLSEVNQANLAYQNLKQQFDQEQQAIEGILGGELLTPSAFMELAAKLNIFAGIYRQILSLDYQNFFVAQLNLLLFDGFFVALGSAMFSLLGFYVASAAYRAFRIRSMESGLMMLAAVIVMLGQIPFGIWLWGDLPALRLWLLEVPNSAAFRGIALGAGVAGLIMALRMWLSLETDYSRDRQ